METLGLFFLYFGDEHGGDCILEDNNVVRRGRGRPRKEESLRDRVYRFCGDDDHRYMRDALEEELDKNGGEVLREAIEMLYRFEVK